MSVVKLLTRVASDDNYTKGIASDATMQLGVIFSALIHDVGHLGKIDVQPTASHL